MGIYTEIVSVIPLNFDHETLISLQTLNNTLPLGKIDLTRSGDPEILVLAYSFISYSSNSRLFGVPSFI